MGYEIAVGRAWDELEKIPPSPRYTLTFLGNRYEVRTDERLVIAQPSGAQAAEGDAILMLHYLIGVLERGYRPTGEWISFREIEGGDSFYPAFYESTIKPLVKGFGRDPEGLVENIIDSFGGRRVDGGDVAVEVPVFSEVRVRMIFWRGDEDFLPDATILFDGGLSGILSTEDIAVLLLFVVQRVLKA